MSTPIDSPNVEGREPDGGPGPGYSICPKTQQTPGQVQHTEGLLSTTGTKNPFAATVDDYPKEDVMLMETQPAPRPSYGSAVTTSSATKETETDAAAPHGDRMTVTQGFPSPQAAQVDEALSQGQPQGTTGPLRYAGASSPAVIAEATSHSVESSTVSGTDSSVPPSIWSGSSVLNSHHSDVSSQGTWNGEAHWSRSPQHTTPKGGPTVTPWANQTPSQSPSENHVSSQRPNVPNDYSHASPAWHASPGMAYGNPAMTPLLTHAGPEQTRLLGNTMPQPLPPHPQNLPVTGYQMLALKLTGASLGFPLVKPIYRRFEALSHRLLLQLQDELAELEQQLESIDAADTQARATPTGFAPASRRPGNMAQAELEWQKQGTLVQIGWKLEQYNKIISSFKDLQYFPPPSPREIEDYRGFLTRGQPIASSETKFLDDSNDLVSLASSNRDETPAAGAEDRVGDSATPTPPSSSIFGSPQTNAKFSFDNNKARQLGTESRPFSPIYLAYAVIVAILIPILTFAVIPGFLERMVIVMLVFFGVAAVLVQSGLLAILGGNLVLDCILCTGVYGGLMAVVASIFA